MTDRPEGEAFMSANPNRWPNPARPGVPLNPERDGWHWLEPTLGASAAWPVYWFACDGGYWNWQTDNKSDHEEYAEHLRSGAWKYRGPCLTPEEVAAREKAAYQQGWSDREDDFIAGTERSGFIIMAPEELAAREAAAAEAMRGASADKVRDKAVQLANAGAVTLSEEWHEVSVVIRALPLPAPDALARAIQAAVAAEREACAEIVAFWPAGITTAAQEQIAAAIRARKDQP